MYLVCTNTGSTVHCPALPYVHLLFWAGKHTSKGRHPLLPVHTRRPTGRCVQNARSQGISDTGCWSSFYTPLQGSRSLLKARDCDTWRRTRISLHSASSKSHSMKHTPYQDQDKRMLTLSVPEKCICFAPTHRRTSELLSTTYV